MSARPQTALLLGATGAVGRHLLRALLASPQIERVGEYGRRTTSKEQLPPQEQWSSPDKLVQREIDFERLEDAGLGDTQWDMVLITLGTTRSDAGSAQAFEKIDREYVVNAARHAKSKDGNVKQRLAMGANPKASFLFPRSKGLTEQALADLGYSETVIFRPAFLKGAKRDKARPAEAIAGGVMGALSVFTSGLEIPVDKMGTAMLRAGSLGVSELPSQVTTSQAGTTYGPYTVIGNKAAVKLAAAKITTAKI